MKNILIVEDNIQIREEIKAILVKENFMVFEASNGIEGLEVTYQHSPDLILSDISMPQLDGYGFLGELRKQAKTEDIPFVFLSAKVDLKDIRTGMNMGAEDYLTKPISPDDLLTTINHRLNEKAKRDIKLNGLKYHVTRYLPHELITPLNGILGFSDYLRHFSPSDEKELVRIAESIHRSGERLQRLIQNYLLYTKLYLELNIPGEENLKTANLFIPSDQFAELLIPYVIETRKDDLKLMVDDVTIPIDMDYLLKIIEELVSNSIKFSKPGDRIVISSYNALNEFTLKIENRGEGISPQQIEEIGLFKQFDRDSKEQQGMGMGLEIVRLITKLYKGKFIIESQKKQYFNVIITIPLSVC
jgi:two-component system, sensor histidine kinase and response regulator